MACLLIRSYKVTGAFRAPLSKVPASLGACPPGQSLVRDKGHDAGPRTNLGPLTSRLARGGFRP